MSFKRNGLRKQVTEAKEGPLELRREGEGEGEREAEAETEMQFER